MLTGPLGRGCRDCFLRLDESWQSWDSLLTIFFDEGLIGVARHYERLYPNILYTGKPGSGVPKRTPDEEWLEYAGKNGWIGITKDKRILNREKERRAIIQSKMRLIVLVNASSNASAQQIRMVDSVWGRIPTWVRDHKPPWVVRVYRDTHHNIKDEFLHGDELGGGWII